MTVLSVRDLSVAFSTDAGPLTALRHVSFDVPRDRIVGIVGESGCGKSTLINAILGLLSENGRIESGAIIFDDAYDLARLEAAEMRALRGPRIAAVFQDPMGALNPVISIGRQMENIQYRSKINRAEKTRRAEEMLRLVRIPDPVVALHRYPHQFSGGMRQRVTIAMALMMEPDLLIADEPTTALDATLEVVTIELLKELQKRVGCSIMFISHHLGVVAELCDEVIVMYAGEVVEKGPAGAIFSKPRHPYTARLLECDPARQIARRRRLPTIPGQVPDLRNRPTGCIFAARCHMRIAECSMVPPEVKVGTGHSSRCIRTNEV